MASSLGVSARDDGPNGDPARLGSQPDHIIVERFLSQALALPLCAAVISSSFVRRVRAKLRAAMRYFFLRSGVIVVGG